MSMRQRLSPSLIVARLCVELADRLTKTVFPGRRHVGANLEGSLIFLAVSIGHIENKPFTANKLASYLGIPRSNILRHLAELETIGMVEKRGHLYHCVPESYRTPQWTSQKSAVIRAIHHASAQLAPVPDLWPNHGVTIDANDNPALLWACLPDGSGMKHNPAWCAHYNMTEEKARTGWKYTAHPDDSPSLLEPWLRSLATGDPYEVEVRRRDLTGEYRWYRTVAVPVFQNGKIIKWCGVNNLVDTPHRPSVMDGPLWPGRFPRTKAKVLTA